VPKHSGSIFKSLTEASGPTLVRKVERQLLQAIIEGKIQLGGRVTEAEYARQMAISRAPLREAARLLEQRGLLITKPGRGFFVRKYTKKELDDIYSVRLCIEEFAVREAIEKANDEDLNQLQLQRDRLGKAASSRSRHKSVEEDIRLHEMVVSATGNDLLRRMFDVMAGDLLILISRLADLEIDSTIVAKSHDDWLQPLLARDSKKALVAIHNHIYDGWQDIRSRLDLLTAT